MVFRLIYSVIALVAFIGIARADCAGGSCSLANRSRTQTTVRASSSVAVDAVAAPVRVAERSVLRVRQSAGATRGRLFHRRR